MLALARDRTATASIQTRYVVGDLLDEAWPVAGDDFCEWIILRAVLHHIPGLKNRLGILKHAAGLLAPGGRLILANWQFLEIERLRRRLLPWAALGLSSEDIEAGDYLLDWQREGCGLRYVHWVDEAETQYLAQATGLHIEALFRADGHNNNLTLYAVLRFP
jgi:SAM-dependent methyltransferase